MIKQSFVSLVNFMTLHPKISTPAEKSRAEIAFLGSVTLCAICTFVYFKNESRGAGDLVRGALIPGYLSYLTALLLIKFKGAVTASANFTLLGIFTFMTYATYHSGGILSPTAMSISLTAMVGLLIGGVRTSLFDLDFVLVAVLMSRLRR